MVVLEGVCVWAGAPWPAGPMRWPLPCRQGRGSGTHICHHMELGLHPLLCTSLSVASMQQPSHCVSLSPTGGSAVEAAHNTYLEGFAMHACRALASSWPWQSLRTRCWWEGVRGLAGSWLGVSWPLGTLATCCRRALGAGRWLGARAEAFGGRAPRTPARPAVSSLLVLHMHVFASWAEAPAGWPSSEGRPQALGRWPGAPRLLPRPNKAR